jgi:catalase
MQQAVHHGRTPYLPNAVGGGCPFLAADEDGGYAHVPREVHGAKTRERGPDDEYAQATLFWRSMTDIERDHIVEAFTFELSKVDVPAVVERMVTRLTLIDEQLARRVCVGLGLSWPVVIDDAADAAPAEDDAPDPTGGLDESPALSMVTEDLFPADGRVVQILANDGADLAGIRSVQESIIAAGAAPHVVATHKGAISGKRAADQLPVDRSFHTASSAEADAVVIAAGAGLANEPAVITFVQSAFRHFKPIAAWGDGVELLHAAGIPADAPGVVTSERATKAFGKAVLESMAVHRHWERAGAHPTLVAIGEEA